MTSAADIGLTDLEDVLTNIFGMEGSDIGGHEWLCLCPVHEQDGEEHTPSCNVNLETGLWSCWSCPADGDIVELGAVVLNRKRKEIHALLRPDEPTAIGAAVHSRTMRRKQAVTLEGKKERVQNDVPPLGFYDDGPLNSLIARGLTLETLRKWGVRFTKSAFFIGKNNKEVSISNSVAIPILGDEGKPVCWVYRATEDSMHWQRKKAKYVYTPGLSGVLAVTWFGGYEHRDKDEIAVVEGSLDAMWLDQCGIPAVAMLGTNTKQFEKIDKLLKYRQVTILPDRDQPGLLAAISLGERLQSCGVPVRIGLYREWMGGRNGGQASDPQDLAPVDVELMYETAEPWHQWKKRLP